MMECKIVSLGVQIVIDEEEEEEDVKMKVIDQVEMHSLT